MGDFVFNIAKGRAAELYNRVDQNDPATAVLLVVVIDTSSADSVLIDLDTLAAVLADGNTAEVTNTNYARKSLSDSDLSAFSPDDANDRVDLDIADQTFSSIAAGDGWTDVLICYQSDPTSSPESAIVPLTQHDFAVTPDGSDITVQVTNFFRAS